MTDSIRFEQVSKAYRLGAGRESLREMLSRSANRLLRKDDVSNERQILWALKEVSFSLQAGQALGIIGSNGAGKTTMLKLLSRVTRPTSGQIHTSGRIAAMIELGAGFHPDLTGRENVFLNGAILGLSRKDILARYDNIVAFAELDAFMDTPVKRYSSGMYARLGFAVAAHLDPDILLVDEVLSVGDVNFQQKCYDFISRFVDSGRTTIFVSHNLYAIEQLSQQVLWLDHGRVVASGNAHDVLSAYMRAQDEKMSQISAVQSGQGALHVRRVYLTDAQGNPRQQYTNGEDIVVAIAYEAPQPVQQPHFVVAVWDAATRTPVFLASMLVDQQAPAWIQGSGEIRCHFQAPPLMPRAYQVWGEVWDADCKGLLVMWQPLAAFNIFDEHAENATVSLRHSRADAPVRVPYTWDLQAQEATALIGKMN